MQLLFFKQALNSFDFIQKKKEAGFAKKIGFSYHDNAELLDEILTAHPEVDFIQLQLNYLDWESENIQSRKCYEVAVKHGKPVVVMEPVKGGNLVDLPEEALKLFQSAHPDWSVPSWAIRYAASLENVMVVLSGMSSLAQVEDNTNYMTNFQPLTAQEYQVVEQVTDILNKETAIPCTACRYCVEGCPQHIAIPDYFALYNAKRRDRGFVQANRYKELNKDNGKASDCVECGQCEGACPQHISIIQWLKEVAKTYEK